MQTTRATMNLKDLMGVVRSHGTDDTRLAIFMLNDMGFDRAILRAQEDGDEGLEAAIRSIGSMRTDGGEDAVRLIDLIDEMDD